MGKQNRPHKTNRKHHAAAHQRRRWHWTLVPTLIVVGVAVGAYLIWQPTDNPPAGRRDSPIRTAATVSTKDNEPSEPERYGSVEKPRFVASGKLTMIWDSIRPDVLAQLKAGSTSNMSPQDYVGPDKCAGCHAENHADWSEHPHRWMNAMADATTVVGDFSGATINYLGGKGSFVESDGQYLMRYTSPDLEREYVVTQTIGSRFYQYYIGRGLKGPEPAGHSYYSDDHVLPFGYWIEREAWVPIVHVAEEAPEGQRWESVHSVRNNLTMTSGRGVGPARGVEDRTLDLTLTYAVACNYCHTTFPIGDMLVRMPNRIGLSIQQESFFSLSEYVAGTRPEIWSGDVEPEYVSGKEIEDVTRQFIAMEAPKEAVSLGVSCEACHLGCRDHVQNPETKPAMAPQSPHLHAYDPSSAASLGRTSQNINAACGRCHSGSRPTFAGGMSTWNSTEHTDAMKGSCYSQLNCASCHDPHKAIGSTWAKTPKQDDASCLACHQQFESRELRRLHTHHPAGSPGDRCMNCHMPRINEGMQDVVRTHTIFSPTQADMLESGHPNACNLCHLDKPITWTLEHLATWYRRNYSASAIAASYPDLSQPVGLHWLTSQHEATRLVAASAAAVSGASWMQLAITNVLDDPYLLNRQFAQTSLEQLLGKKLDEAFGYWYYMERSERAAPIARIRQALRE